MMCFPTLSAWDAVALQAAFPRAFQAQFPVRCIPRPAPTFAGCPDTDHPTHLVPAVPLMGAQTEDEA